MDHPVPHVHIRFHHSLGRRLKNATTERTLPLVGMAYWGASRALERARDGATATGWLFPRYASDGSVKNTHASNAVNKLISQNSEILRRRTV